MAMPAPASTRSDAAPAAANLSVRTGSPFAWKEPCVPGPFRPSATLSNGTSPQAAAGTAPEQERTLYDKTPDVPNPLQPVGSTGTASAKWRQPVPRARPGLFVAHAAQRAAGLANRRVPRHAHPPRDGSEQEYSRRVRAACYRNSARRVSKAGSGLIRRRDDQAITPSD